MLAAVGGSRRTAARLVHAAQPNSCLPGRSLPRGRGDLYAAHCQHRALHSLGAVRTIYESDCHDPFVNLAYEQYLFEQADAFPLVFLYRNAPSVVIGRNQNPWIECDIHQMTKQRIDLVRRFSGGGTVYHDLGNVNYTFFTHRDHFRRDAALSKVAGILRNRLNLDVALNERHDLVCHRSGQTYKCSGSAFKISKARSYAHGTMLLSSDLSNVRDILRPPTDLRARIEARGVQSVRSPVANLNISLAAFRECVLEAFQMDSTTVVSSEEMQRRAPVGRSAATIRQWEWTFGQTPGFEYDHRKVKMHVRDGRISSCRPHTDDLSWAACQRLVGTRFDPAVIEDRLAGTIEETS